jgi:predicted transposase YdaD
LPVRSVVILLRPKAYGPEMSGVVRHAIGDEQYLEFRYRIVRIWQKPVESVLAGGVGTLPLAPLADVKEGDLPAVIRRMKQRLSAETPPNEEAVLWTSTYVLMGLRYNQTVAGELLKGVMEMEESVTYQEIIRKGEAKGRAEGQAEGAAEEARRILLRIGTKLLGAPDANAVAAIEAISNRERLENLIDRVSEVKSWSELFGNPAAARRNGRKRK